MTTKVASSVVCNAGNIVATKGFHECITDRFYSDYFDVGTHRRGYLSQVFGILSGNNDLCHASTMCRNQLFLYTTNSKHAPAQRNFTRHGRRWWN